MRSLSRCRQRLPATTRWRQADAATASSADRRISLFSLLQAKETT
jgi:hypothetical protein